MPLPCIAVLGLLRFRAGNAIGLLSGYIERQFAPVQAFGIGFAGHPPHALRIRKAFDADGPVFTIFFHNVEVVVRFYQDFGFAIASEPPAVLPAAGRLYAQKRVAAVENMAFYENETGVVFVYVILLVSLRQAADDEKTPLMPRHATRPVNHFGQGVFGKRTEAVSIVNIDP